MHECVHMNKSSRVLDVIVIGGGLVLQFTGQYARLDPD